MNPALREPSIMLHLTSATPSATQRVGDIPSIAAQENKTTLEQSWDWTLEGRSSLGCEEAGRGTYELLPSFPRKAESDFPVFVVPKDQEVC